jgi:hypothetical protein
VTSFEIMFCKIVQGLEKRKTYGRHLAGSLKSRPPEQEAGVRRNGGESKDGQGGRQKKEVHGK